MKYMFSLILLCNFIVFNLANNQVFQESIFDETFCNITCQQDKPHTMCERFQINAQCKDFDLTKFATDTDTRHLMQLLVEGHNGIRSRVADKMGVANMLEMTWDSNLALMAENFLHLCEDTLMMDSCTKWPEAVKEDDSFTGFFDSQFSYKQIVQNVFHEKVKSYPYKFIERVLRAWYFEKEGMREPVVSPKGTEYFSRLMGENNFTHMINPLTFRFGCAMAGYTGYYHLVCNYFPFFRTSTNTMYFVSGNPVERCPSKFPMKDKMFPSLCTADTESFFENISSRGFINVFALFFCTFCVMFLCL